MGKDQIPAKDVEFDEFLKRFLAKVLADLAKYGLTVQDGAVLQSAAALWNTAFPAHSKAQGDAEAATITKDKARAAIEEALRGIAKKLKGTASVDDPMLVDVGLAPRETTRTAVGAPTTEPLGRIEVLKGRRFVIHFVDSESPTRLGKPAGVQGCQVWSFVGDAPPADPSGYHFLGLDTRTPYVDEHDVSLVGKTAYYLLRWQNSKGQAGPWSDVVMAKIPA